MLSYQYRKFHCGDKTSIRSSYLHNEIPYIGKTASLYWISTQVPVWYRWNLWMPRFQMSCKDEGTRIVTLAMTLRWWTCSIAWIFQWISLTILNDVAKENVKTIMCNLHIFQGPRGWGLWSSHGALQESYLGAQCAIQNGTICIELQCWDPLKFDRVPWKLSCWGPPDLDKHTWMHY